LKLAARRSLKRKLKLAARRSLKTEAEAGKAAAACFARSAMSLTLDAEDRLKLQRTDAAQSLMLTLNANATAQVLLPHSRALLLLNC
jgi:hypothetical protein